MVSFGTRTHALPLERIARSGVVFFIGEALKPNGRSFRHAFRSAISRCVAIEDMAMVRDECVVLLSSSSSSSSSDVMLLNE